MVQCPVMRVGFLIFLLGTILLSSHVFCQEYQQNELGWSEENRIERAVDGFVQSHKHRLGIFRFQPRLSVHGGADSNTVFGNEGGKEKNDFFISVVPGISGGLRFGSRAYLRIAEDYNFLYYFKHKDRRDIFGTTYAEFVTGTPQVLVTFDGNYARRNTQVNQEVDEPIEHKEIVGGAFVDYSLSPKVDIRHTFHLHNTNFVETEATLSTGLHLFDRRTYSVGTAIGYALKRTLRLRSDVTFSRSETLETNQVSQTVQLIGGIEIARDRLSYGFEAGFGRSKQAGADASNHNFLLDGRVDYRLTRKLTVGGFVSRRYDFSFLSDVATIVLTQAQAHFNSAVAKRLNLSGYYTVGRNDFGDAIVSGVVVNHDTFQHAELGLGIQTFKGLSVRPGIRYLKRVTDIPGLSKSDFFWFVSLGFGYSFNL